MISADVVLRERKRGSVSACFVIKPLYRKLILDSVFATNGRTL